MEVSDTKIPQEEVSSLGREGRRERRREGVRERERGREL